MRKYITGIVALVILFGLGGVLYVSKGAEEDVLASLPANVSLFTAPFNNNHIDPEVISRPEAPPPDTVKYSNTKYGFSFYHSPEAKITEYDEGGGATTIVLENFVKVRGMQIFIVPYTEDKISEERFKMDVPSGIRKNEENITIGRRAIPAVTFNSYDQLLGDTREIWFIYNGHLYEITTFKGVAGWLTPIIQSWRFSP